MTLMPEMTLAEAQAMVASRIEDGVRCPCCTQFVKMYNRAISSQLARALVVLYREGGTTQFKHWPTLAYKYKVKTDAAKLRYWGLIEEGQNLRPDGGKAGWWRVTPKGENWIRGYIKIEKYATTFDSQLGRLHGPMVTLEDALGKQFDLRELMS